MENKILEILQLMQKDMKLLKEDVSSLKEDVSSLKEDVSSLKEDNSTMKTDMKKMHGKIDKNTIILEEMQAKLEIVAEVQQAHREQNERHSHEIVETINDRSSLIEKAVQRTSKDLKEIKENVEVLTEMTGKHEVEIKVLQRRPV